MSEQNELPCATCGMACKPGEFHPYAACLMFKACRSSDVVRANLADHVAAAARIAELQRQLEARDKALALLAGLHPCVTTDDPQALSQQVFDAVMSETSDLRKEAATSRAQAEEYAALASKAMKQANAAERQLEEARKDARRLRAAAGQASFCLRELFPNDDDAKFTVRMLDAAVAAEGGGK